MNYQFANNKIGSAKPTKIHNYSSPSQSSLEVSSNPITRMVKLRKITPKTQLNQASSIRQSGKEVNSPLESLDQQLDLAKKALNKHCRTCAKEKLHLIGIFSKRGIKLKLNQQIRHLKNIEESDSLSTQMCLDCIDDLSMSYTFLMRIKEAEKELKSMQAKLVKTEMANLVKQEEVSPIDHLLISHEPVNLNDSGPRISAVYSVPDPQSWEPDPHFNDEMKDKIQIQEENEVQSDDSIEEFDPDDPPDYPGGEEEKNLVKELENVPSPVKSSEKIEVKSEEPENIKTEGESLKRKISEVRDEAVDRLMKLEGIGPKDAKVKRLSTKEALNIKKEEDGVMHILVRGKKPNEFLIVKVKKIEKPNKKRKNVGEKKALTENKKEQIEVQMEKVKEEASLSETLHQQNVEIPDESLCTKEIIVQEDSLKLVSKIKKKKSKSKKQKPVVKNPVEGKLNNTEIITPLQETVNSEKSVFEEEEEKVEVPEVELHPCDFCFLSLRSKETIDEHMKNHDKRILYDCENCEKQFLTSKGRKQHVKSCARKLLCKYCNLPLDSTDEKKQHEQEHCENIFGALCEFCGEQFNLQKTLQQHLRSKHVGLKGLPRFQCPKCPEKCYFLTQLNFHLKTSHGEELTDSRNECPVCKKMIFPAYFRRHVNGHKPYTHKCPHCNKMFKDSSALNQHVRIHEESQLMILKRL